MVRERARPGWITIGRRAVAGFVADRCSQMAAAIAYQVLVASVPVVALLAALLGALMTAPEVRRAALQRVLDLLPLRQGVVVDALHSLTDASVSLSVVGLVGLVWAAANLFGSVRDALNAAWHVRARHGIVRQKLVDLGTVVAISLLLGASIAGTALLHALHHVSTLVAGRFSMQLELVWAAAAWSFPAVITFGAFVVVYRYVPNVPHGFQEIWPGAVLATTLFEIGKHAFTLYVAAFDRAHALYGALGAVILFLLWVYVSASILLVGAEFSSAYWRASRPAT